MRLGSVALEMRVTVIKVIIVGSDQGGSALECLQAKEVTAWLMKVCHESQRRKLE